MGEGPTEGERQFRRMIESAAEARRRSRRSRRWFEALARPLLDRPGLTLLLLFLLCLGGFFALIFGVAVKWTEAYSCSLAEARRSPLVVAELGEPVEAGFFAWSYGYSHEGSVTDASFRTTLAGPKGEGTLRVQWYRSPLGSSLRMGLERDGQTHTVYAGPIPCR